MASHWFLEEGHTEFRDSIAAIVDEAAWDLCRPDARYTIGDEHDQCQYLFTKMHTLMRERQDELSKHLLRCSKIPEPVIELRYYRSRVRRSQAASSPQFIESETGADFALALQIDLPGILQAERSVLGQAKILDRRTLPLDEEQLGRLLTVGGPESAAYLIWGEGYPPTAVSAKNVAAFARTQSVGRLNVNLFALGKPLSEFYCEDFIGLWFGRDYDPEKEDYTPPSTSVGVLYHFLHVLTAPPNVAFFGLSSSDELGVPPGVYVVEQVDIEK